MTTLRPFTRAACLLLGVLLSADFAPAQVKYPPLPEKVDVQIRYRIRATRPERVRQYRELEANLSKLRFERKRTPGDENDILDPTAERMEGVIPSKNVLAILDDPRVRTILFKPTDLQFPDDPAKPVPVRIRLATGYLPAEQHRLHRQVVAQLTRLGFREAVGYDTAGYTLVRGDLPAENVSRLLKDLRMEPSGWFLPDTPPAALPSPLRDALPIRVVEVLANADLTLLNPPPVPPNQLRYEPGLRAVLADKAALDRPIRVEVVMDHRLDPSELDLMRARLRGGFARRVVNPKTRVQEEVVATLEGAVGNVATVQFPQAADLERFAADSGIVVVRLPRAAVETAGPRPPAAKPTPAAELLAATRVAAFQQRGHRGQGTRVVVIATEFPDLGSGMGAKFLDKTLKTPVTFIDLTAELSPTLLPAPPSGPGGAGTAAARAVHLAVPDAGLVLVRVDPAAFFQLYSIARFVRGDREYSQAMQTRFAELSYRTEELKTNEAAAAEEYRKALEDRSEEGFQHRQRASRALDQLQRDGAANAAAIDRADGLQNSMRALAGADVVVNTLVWETGFPFDGLNELARVIDTSFASEALAGPLTRSATRPRPAPRPIWVQAASPSVGSVWGGSFLDLDANGTMEFANPVVKIPAGEWTRELNFLAVRGPDETISPAIPAGTKVRLTVQWRETHDPTSYGGQESIFPLTLRVLRQLDSEGKVRASDELQEVARSVGAPYRVYAEPTFGVYEQVVEFAAPAAGRYCVMVEGQTIFDPRLPALRRHLEIQPRMFAQFVGAAPAQGRPVFTSFAPTDAGVGMPGDAKAAITVAASDAPLGTTTAGLTGGGPGLALLPKPDLLAPGAIDLNGATVGGPGVAAGFAGGVLAGLVGSGAPPAEIMRATGLPHGGPVLIPEGWLRVVPPRP